MIHTIEIKIRGYHLDLFGHVNNARYLEFLEEGRWAMFENAVGIHDFALKGYVFAVVNINITYRKPALMNDILVVASEITRIGRRSAVIHQAVKLKESEASVADADVTFVIFDTQKGKSALLEGDLLLSLEGV